jgi:hypothetical protein
MGPNQSRLLRTRTGGAPGAALRARMPLSSEPMAAGRERAGIGASRESAPQVAADLVVYLVHSHPPQPTS